MPRNRNLVQAQVPVAPGDYSALLAGADRSGVLAEVVAAMNRQAGERSRRVFGEPWQTEATETDEVVWLTFEAYTEPA